MFLRSPVYGWRRLALVFALAVAFSAHGQADPQLCARDWLNTYASQPDPDLLIPAVFELSRTEYFNMPNRVLIGLGFFSSLFRQNPDYIDTWLRYSRMLPEQERRLMISALWMSGHPKGEEYLHLYAEQVVGPDTAAKLKKVLARGTFSLDRPGASSLSALYVRWGEYLATGDDALLYEVLEGLGNQSDAPASDRWWLACTAAENAEALSVCEQASSSAPAVLREAMQLVVEAGSGRSLGG